MVKIQTVGELRRAVKERAFKTLYVWVCWGLDGDYVEVARSKFLTAINADSPSDGAHGGCCDGTEFKGEIREDGCLYVG